MERDETKKRGTTETKTKTVMEKETEEMRHKKSAKERDSDPNMVSICRDD